MTIDTVDTIYFMGKKIILYYTGEQEILPVWVRKTDSRSHKMMTIYENELPSTLANMERIMKEQDEMMKKVQAIGSILTLYYNYEDERLMCHYISETKSSEDSPKVSFEEGELCVYIKWIEIDDDQCLFVHDLKNNTCSKVIFE